MSWRDGEAALAAAVTELEALYAALPALACKGLCQHSCGQHVEASDLEHARARAAGVDLTAATATGACPALVATFGAGHCTIHPVRPMVCRLWGIAASMPCPHGCLPDLAGWSAQLDGGVEHGRSGMATGDQVLDADADIDAPLRTARPEAAQAVDAGNARSAAGQRPSQPYVEPGASTHGARSGASPRLSDAVALRSMMAVLRLGGHEAAAPGVTELLEACASDELAARLMARLLRGDASVKPALGVRLQQLRSPAPPVIEPARAAPSSAARTAVAASPEGSRGGGA